MLKQEEPGQEEQQKRWELKQELSELMHDLIFINKEIMCKGNYDNLLKLCEQDITIISVVSHGGNITAKELSKQLHLPKTTVVSAIKRLEERGYICRMPNEADKREMLLFLSEKGKKTNKEHLDYEENILNYLVSCWGTEEQNQLCKLLKLRKK